jgi:hypothetical protein
MLSWMDIFEREYDCEYRLYAICMHNCMGTCTSHAVTLQHNKFYKCYELPEQLIEDRLFNKIICSLSIPLLSIIVFVSTNICCHVDIFESM